MSLNGLLVRNVAVHAVTYTSDRDNNQVATWTPAGTVNGWLAQSSRAEDLDQRHAEISSWSLTVPQGTALSAGDRVVIDGQTFEVDGPPNTAWTPRGPHHIEATLKVVAG